MKAFIFIAAVLLLVPAASALEISDYNMLFQIQDDLSVKEFLSIDFSQPLEQKSLNYILVENPSDIRVTDGRNDLRLTQEQTTEGTKVSFVVPDNTTRLTISFTARNLVFSSDSVHQFFTNFRPPSGTDRIEMLVSLPEGYVLYGNSIYPETGEKLTDGKNIYFRWIFTGQQNDIPVSVKFEKVPQIFERDIYVIVITVLVAAMAGFYLYHRKRTESESLRGFTADECRLIAKLRSEKVCYQHNLEKEFGFSKAKVTRIVKKLEGSGLVTKDRIGKKNKIYWKK